MLLSYLEFWLNVKEFSSKYLRSQIQYFFLLMLCFLVPWTMKFLLSFTQIVQSLKESNPSYPWPQYSDLIKSLLISLILLASSSIFRRLMIQTGEKLISSKYKGIERGFRSEKLVDCIFKGAYYIFSSSYGFYVAKDCEFFTKYLGGQGHSLNMFIEYPYLKIQNYEEIKLYLVIQLGYHLFSLFQHMLKKAKNDYIEMLLHHLVTVALISIAYFMNYVTISVVILFVHDFSDVFGYIVRIFVDTEYKSITLIGYVGLLVTWLYLRILVFPFDIIRNSIYLNPTIRGMPGTVLLCVMLHCLVILHVYWYYLFIQMGLKFVKTKTAQDTYHVE